jgi:hypothetical protein
VRSYVGHVVVGDCQYPEAATVRQEGVSNCPVLALGDKSGRIDRLTRSQLQQITMFAADASTIALTAWRFNWRKTGHRSYMTTLLGVLLIGVAVIAGVIGVGWLFLDAVGREWDYCRGGDCIAGWKMGAGFTLVAVVTAVVGLSLLRGERAARPRAST